MAKKLVKNYVFSPGLGLDNNARPNAYSLISQNRTFLIKEIIGFIQGEITASNPDYSGYTYDTQKCERDSGYVIDALLFDLRYNGNEETRRISSFYWSGTVPQIDGTRIPEYESYQFLRDTINTYILTNTLNPSPKQNLATQVVDQTKTTEASTTARVTALLNDVIAVIENGLTSLPALDIGLGRVELLGKIGLEDLLIITNVTDNTVIYNFAEPTKGAQTTFIEGNSESYPQAESVNNGVTIINFKFDTSSMSDTDTIQIFFEESELSVRLNTIATDAMERVKVGIPQAMLDADFEYGLQPTKWQALAFQRGYPSTYELPASDIPVVNVTTDASAGTSDIGASLITVTTLNQHGLEIGDPITIRALASSVTGFNRAEGTFLVIAVPTTTSFRYYAKSKVGDSDGQVLAISNTQLRKADFYTGAEIRGATFSVQTNGASGDFATTLRIPQGSTTLAFTGDRPPIGAPITSPASAANGTQVTAVFGDDNEDGIVTTKFVSGAVLSGASSVSLVDVSGIQAGMVLSNGASPAVQTVITSIVGNTLNLSAPLQTNYQGDIQTYTGVVLSLSNYITGTGTGARFNVAITDGEYAVTLNTGGSGYLPGDTLLIDGTAVGGFTGVNDITLNVLTVSSGAVLTFEFLRGTGQGTASFSNVASTQETNTTANNVLVSITRNAGTYTAVVTSGGTGINRFNRFLITGDLLGGSTTANDCTLTVQTVSDGAALTVSAAGTAARGSEITIYAAVSISQPTTALIAAAATVEYSAIATIEVVFESNHGFVPGAGILVAIQSVGANHQLAAGPYFINEIVNLTTIRYIARAAGTINTDDVLQGTIYIRPDAYFSHRPFDGGVQLSTGGPQHGAHAVRMSKKYIRYQSGKGAMYNTGALFAPSFDVLSITAVATTPGSLITVETDDVDHGLQAGSTIKIRGTLTVGYDGEYVVNEIVNERIFKIVAATTLGATTAVLGPQCQVSLYRWSGAVVRSGPFDDQNGIFWQYDGNIMSVGRRTSTFQLAGTVSIESNSSTVTGSGTRFKDQLQEGDRIVIRGMTHVVTHISSNTSMSVNPFFRGVSNITGGRISKVEELIIPQNEWNLDRCDGTGPSGYTIDVTKMQMIGIQFTWYGAGFVDWMLRGPDGNYVFCHRLKGNNLNTEAYMRTGNLPVRYEVLNESARSKLNANINSSVSTIPLVSVRDFPDSGTVYIDNELIRYTGRNTVNNTLTGCVRGTNLSNFSAGSLRTFTAGAAASHTEQQGVVLVSTTTSPIISHWGSAYLIDGQFDDDRGYIFSYAATGISMSTVKTTAFLIRLAPSVSNAVVGDLGERELLNRAQLLLSEISITSDPTESAGTLVVEGVLNPINYPANPSNIIWNGLSNTAAGGQPSFAQIALGGSVSWGDPEPIIETATVQGALTQTFTTSISGGSFTNAIQSGRNRFFLTDANAASSGIEINDIVTAGFFPAGTRITSITPTFEGRPHTRYETSANATSTVSAPTTPTLNITAAGTAASYVNTNFLFFTATSWNATGAKLGSLVASTETVFPSNTRVSSLVFRSLGATNVVRVSFTQTSNGTVAAAAEIDFDLTPPPHALPGELVFSFLANPGETVTLSLDKLKELTTTAIGGRGTFPNGPDVLAINVYKVKGTAVDANVLLRWSEAQA